ncbi:MAG: amidase [Acidimicrobiia bacterium]|nr:amidase [Acidimicrobiia bacterium]
MIDGPWDGDAVSLVEAFRAGTRSPLEELDATLAAIEASDINAFSHLDPDAARAAAAAADVSQPFGGVPIGVKELDSVAGWPATEASVPLKDEIAPHDSTKVARLRTAGAIPIGLTTSSEFGGVNLTYTRLNGATRNPWHPEHTPGGSSGGSAAAVAGGLVTLATGGDGGGSIRIPAGFTGLPGLKATYGRIPKGPDMVMASLTAVSGCLSRSVRDIARYFDHTNGFDHRDPYSLPRVEGWEAGLGSLREALRGKRVAVSIDLGSATVDDEVAAAVDIAARALIADAGLELVDIPIKTPELSYEWALSGLSEIVMRLGDRYPDCADDLTPEIKFGMQIVGDMYDIKARARIEAQRVRMNETMAAIFDQVDFVLASTNPNVAFGSTGPLPTMFNGVDAGPGNNGALTIPSNIFGNPAMQIPAGFVRGLPVGLQVLGKHHSEPLLLELAHIVEQARPWPLTAS